MAYLYQVQTNILKAIQKGHVDKTLVKTGQPIVWTLLFQFEWIILVEFKPLPDRFKMNQNKPWFKLRMFTQSLALI